MAKISDELVDTEQQACSHCGEEFSALRKHGNPRKYCSLECVKQVAYARQRRKISIGIASGILYGKPIEEVIFNRYRQCAKKRGIAFSITLEEFSSFWRKPCVYCGDTIETIGLDRMNNDIGYEVENIIPCCRECNLMKRGLLAEEFISRCAKVAERSRRKLIAN